MTVLQILGYVTALLQDWGVMPYIQAGLLLITVIGAIVLIRRLATGS